MKWFRTWTVFTCACLFIGLAMPPSAVARSSSTSGAKATKKAASTSPTSKAKSSVAGRATSTKVAKASSPKLSKHGKAAVGLKPTRVAKGKSRKGRHAVAFVPAVPSVGSQMGLQSANDPLDLKSNAALVLDQDTNEVLLSKNADAVLPIASLTKLMTALVVMEAKLPLDEVLTLSDEDVNLESRMRSRLQAGASLSRGKLLHLALMSSENRAAHALGRNYPGGLTAFVAQMNQRATQLGMSHSHFVEPTGLSSDNRSSAQDLATLVKATYRHQLIRELSTSPSHEVELGERQIQYRNTNLLVANPTWNIGLQKTGYIAAAGRCLVMQVQMAGRKLVMVFLDSAGKYSRLGDAERVRKWLVGSGVTSSAQPVSSIDAFLTSASSGR